MSEQGIIEDQLSIIYDKWEKDFADKFKKYEGSPIDIFHIEDTYPRMELLEGVSEKDAKKYIDYIEKNYKELRENKKYLKDKEKYKRLKSFIQSEDFVNYLESAFFTDKLKKESVEDISDEEIEKLFTNLVIGSSVITNEHRKYILGALSKFYTTAEKYSNSKNPNIRGMSKEILKEISVLFTLPKSIYSIRKSFNNYKILKNFVKHMDENEKIKLKQKTAKSKRHSKIKESDTFNNNPYKRITSVELEMVGGNTYSLINKNKKQNNIELDESLGNYGTEYQISMHNGDSLFNELDKGYKELRESGYTINLDTGLHFHYNTSDFKKDDYKRLVDIIAKVEDHIFNLVDESRRNNNYVIPVKGVIEVLSQKKEDPIDKFMKVYGINHYSATNLESINTTMPHVEFRYAGAVDNSEIAKAYSLMYNSLLESAKKKKNLPKKMSTIDFIKWLNIPKKYEEVLINRYKELEEDKMLYITVD